MTLARRAAIGRDLSATSFLFRREYGWWSVNAIVVGRWATGIGIVHHDVGSLMICTVIANVSNRSTSSADSMVVPEALDTV
jgi:hypothetical protein